MAKFIEIENLKNVKRLAFEMPGPGVWLLTGENGSGKTTLLACLHRLGDRQAFPRYFQTSNVSDRLDAYSDAKITFKINDAKVEYTYAGSRWAPRPKKNSNIVNGFGYSNVLFIAANSDRISPKPDDFGTDRIHAVSGSIKDAANRIFNTDKFKNLRKVNVTRGQNTAFVFKAGNNYYSEKNFSLGELCVLKLLTKVQSSPANSLVVVDELEMALHPSAQIRLYHYLKEIANRDGHTIIFSTHSVSLIKTASRNSLIYLRRTAYEIVAERKPYLSAVLGGLAHVEEKSADAVIYVEDEMAELSARTLVNLVSAARIGERKTSAPKIEVVPIGGFHQVISFLKRHDALHRSSVKSFALLDLDVKDETVASWQANEDVEKLAWLQEYEGRIQYLPWTPEVGMVALLLEPGNEFLEELRSRLDQNQLQFSQGVNAPVDPTNRDQCKAWARDTISFWCEQFGVTRRDCKLALCSALASLYFSRNKAQAMQTISPLIS